MHGRVQRLDHQGRHLFSHDGEETLARARDRAREPVAVYLLGRFGRCQPAASNRGVSRPRALRPHLLQSGDAIGGRHSAGRRGDGLVHGRGAYVPAMSDETIIVRNQGTIFLGGPPLVRPRPARRSRPRNWAVPTCMRAGRVLLITMQRMIIMHWRCAGASSPISTRRSEFDIPLRSGSRPGL